MSEYCFEVVAAIAIERSEIGITCSSTPLGKRSHFYRMCTDPKMNYSQHFHHPTSCPSASYIQNISLVALLLITLCPPPGPS